MTHRTNVNVARDERLLSIVAGFFLTLVGLARLPLSAVVLVLGGAYLLFRGVKGRCYLYELLEINKAVGTPADRIASRDQQPPTVPDGDEVTNASWDSFPASDPPAWTMGRRDRAPRQQGAIPYQ